MDIETLYAKLQTMKAELDSLIVWAERARKEKDPLAAHIRQARLAYRQAVATDGKSGKRIGRVREDSFLKAGRLGFEGTMNEWLHVLRPGA